MSAKGVGLTSALATLAQGARLESGKLEIEMMLMLAMALRMVKIECLRPDVRSRSSFTGTKTELLPSAGHFGVGGMSAPDMSKMQPLKVNPSAVVSTKIDWSLSAP
jgi:hypothetical protein